MVKVLSTRRIQRAVLDPMARLLAFVAAIISGHVPLLSSAADSLITAKWVMESC